MDRLVDRSVDRTWRTGGGPLGGPLGGPEGRTGRVDRLEGLREDRTEGRSVDRLEGRPGRRTARWRCGRGWRCRRWKRRRGCCRLNIRRGGSKPVLLPRAVQQGGCVGSVETGVSGVRSGSATGAGACAGSDETGVNGVRAAGAALSHGGCEGRRLRRRRLQHHLAEPWCRHLPCFHQHRRS